jgi:peptide/nickel transport system permease protein
VVALGAPVLVPHDPDFGYVEGISQVGQPLPPGSPGPPSRPGFLLGTDNIGRDLLSRLIFGARISLTIGIVANGLAMLIGMLVGLTAGYFGGAVETVLMRFTDVLMSLPPLLFALALIAVYKPGIGVVIGVIAVIYWTYLARIIHGRVLSVREQDFVDAARCLGATDTRILLRYVLPQLIGIAVVYASLGAATTILTEATLSYLGIGVQPPTASWGTMIQEGQQYYRTAPWLILFPGLMILLVVLGFNLLGDGLRDALDPRQQRR